MFTPYVPNSIKGTTTRGSGPLESNWQAAYHYAMAVGSVDGMTRLSVLGSVGKGMLPPDTCGRVFRDSIVERFSVLEIILFDCWFRTKCSPSHI